MDLKLPLMDGYEATRQILNHTKTKYTNKYKSLPSNKYEHLKPSIVALTACVSDVDKEKCKELGMKAFLSKPIDQDELETMLEIIIKRRISSSQKKI
jgi:CheY-like chemotaxis protein